MDWTLLLPGGGLAVGIAIIVWIARRDPTNRNPVYGKRKVWGMGQRRF